MEIREGLIPTVLGTAVTATGAMMKRRDMAPMIAAGIVGFGLAHVVLGTIDMIQHMDEER
ncbi:MAG: asparagine synthase [Thermotaleaceae bacterium]